MRCDRGTKRVNNTQFDDIRGGECLLRQVGKEELVDDARTYQANGTLLFARRMRCQHYATQNALSSHRHLRTVVETAHHLTFRALLELIWWKVQARLDQRMIEDGVVFAAGHKSEGGQIRKHSSGSILAVEPRASCAEIRVGAP